MLAHSGDSLTFGSFLWSLLSSKIILVGIVSLVKVIGYSIPQCVTQLLNADVLLKGLKGSGFLMESVHKSNEQMNPIWKWSLPISVLSAYAWCGHLLC